MSDSENSPLDLTGLDFGPAWAKDEKPVRDYSKEVGPREGRDRRGGGGGGPRREGRGGDRRNDQKGRGTQDRRGDRRQPDRRNDDRRKGGNRREHRERAPQIPAPEGFTGSVMPVEEGLDNLSREIQAGGRTYSVFDLARVVMGARERFNVTFEAPKGTLMFRCKSDGSIWLNKEEAIQQFWRANLISELYEEVESEVEAPKGSFTTIAKCGLSGEWLGPPNYHSYPTTVATLHAERFAHMSLEDYKRKIRTESGEEVVNAWMESMKKQIRFRPLSTDEILALRETRKAEADAAKKPQKQEKDNSSSSETAEAASSEPAAEPTAETEAPASPEAEVRTEETVVAEEASAPTEESTEETVVAESDAEDASEQSEDTQTSPEPESGTKEEDLLADRREVERHFTEHHFKHLFAEVNRAWVPGNVAGKLLSPALLTLLKETVAEERRYPSKLTPVLCRQLSGRHLAVFKWKKKLKAGPARPHAVPADLSLADRPQQLLDWIRKNSTKNLEALWKDCLPENADEELKRSFYHDLHWLLNQGYVLLMADSTLHLAKEASAPEPTPQNKSEPSEKPSPESKEEATPQEAAPAESPTSETKPEEPEPATEPANDAAAEPSAESPASAPEVKPEETPAEPES